jgi:endonuclease VIII
LRTAEYYYAERAKLGHDPLREDADADALWERIKASKKPIGGILMDQTLIAGVGNIYRAEVDIYADAIVFEIMECVTGF